jgi:two-component system OmpR family response regulator
LNRQITQALEQSGYAVDRAFDGEEGQFLGETEAYDAIVLDIGLPKRTASPCWSNGAPRATPCRC